MYSLVVWERQIQKEVNFFKTWTYESSNQSTFPIHSFGLSQKKILKAQQSAPKPQVDTTIDLDTPPRQQTPEVKKTPEVQQIPEEVASTSFASTSQASTSSASRSQAASQYVYRVEEYHKKCFLFQFFFKSKYPKFLYEMN